MAGRYGPKKEGRLISEKITATTKKADSNAVSRRVPPVGFAAA